MDSVGPGRKRDVRTTVDDHTAWRAVHQGEYYPGKPEEFPVGEILLANLDEVHAPGREPADPLIEGPAGKLPPVCDVIVEEPVTL